MVAHLSPFFPPFLEQIFSDPVLHIVVWERKTSVKGSSCSHLCQLIYSFVPRNVNKRIVSVDPLKRMVWGALHSSCFLWFASTSSSNLDKYTSKKSCRRTPVVSGVNDPFCVCRYGRFLAKIQTPQDLGFLPQDLLHPIPDILRVPNHFASHHGSDIPMASPVASVRIGSSSSWPCIHYHSLQITFHAVSTLRVLVSSC